MTTWKSVARFLGRVTVVAVALVIAGFVGVQFARIIKKNVMLSRELANVSADVLILRERREHQQAAIRRLSDPRGAIPEIHDRLRLAAPREAIVYLKKAPAVAP